MNETKDVSRLPKWARSIITQLKRDVEHLEENLAVATAQKPTHIYYTRAGEYGDSKKNYIPDHSTVSFVLKDGTIIQAHLGLKDELLVTGYNRCVKILPTAANCFEVQGY